MPPKTINSAILFADVSGSTKLFETLGDNTARATISACLDSLLAVTLKHSGTLVKTIGDEIMCTFSTADDAAKAAINMQETLEEDMDEETGDDTILSIRIGFHFGSAIIESRDIFGDAVNVAARMAAQAKGGQIITTQSSVELLSPVLKASSRFVDKTPIKGKKEDIAIYEIIWQEEDVTRMATSLVTTDERPVVKLKVCYHDKEILMDKERSGLVMGRSQNCDLAINEKLASRQHVRIELRRDRYFIIDQSTNGTYVLFEGSDAVFLRREEIPLQDSGQISLGRSFSEGHEEVVTFTHV